MTGKCKYCGAPLKRSDRVYCSYRCAGLDRQHYKTCVVCGARFAAPPSSDSVTCSPKCSAIQRSRMADVRGHTAKLDNERRLHLQTTAPEDWQTAKGWVLQSPDGKKYECKNLIEFFRTHQDLIDCPPETAARGIKVVKSSMIGGRRKNKVYCWKGWQLLAWDDCGIKPRK